MNKSITKERFYSLDALQGFDMFWIRWTNSLLDWIFKIQILVYAILLFSCQGKPVSQQSKINGGIILEEEFRNPPASVRPWAYWVWSNGNFDYSQLTRDLEEIKAKGMGGFDIFDVGERFPEEGEIPPGPAFLGKESLEAIHYAINEAGRLGLGLGLVTSSSWNAGGSWVKPEHANMALFSSDEIVVKGPARFSEKLPFLSFPNATPSRPDGMPVFYKDIAVIAYPKYEEEIIKGIPSVTDLTAKMDESGQLEWDVPEGEWAITRFICTNTGKKLHMPSLNSQGLVIDHFNPEATEMHFQTIIDRLHSEMGDLKGSALQYLYLCSYEVWGISWTPGFLQEFSERRGYNMVPYLPVLLGYTIQDKELTERFYYDFEKTICDLIVDAHYKNAKEICNKYGFQLCAESGGPGRVPVEALKALGTLDIPRGEFWYEYPLSLIKAVASAANTYGRDIVDQEAFTSWRHWQEGPRDLKALADNAFCNGMNKVTFHTYPHSPPEAGIPGWAFYAGTHIGTNRVWWPKAKPFMDYLSRCCYLLRQGLFVGDVCYYYGDQGFNYVPEKHIDSPLGYGYDYDVTNPEVILTRMEAKNGKIVLPDGMSYELLVLPDRADMDLDVLKKIQQLVYEGITIVGPKPVKTNGLTDYPFRDDEVREIADEVWGNCDGENVKEHKYGKGKVIWGRTLREILMEKGIGQDFAFTGSSNDTALDYIHRKTENEDIYFIRNINKSWEYVICTFRVKGKIPELWLPETGEIKKCPVYKEVEGGIALALTLAPEEAVFIVFRKNKKENQVVSVTRDGKKLFPGIDGKILSPRMFDIRIGKEGSEIDFIAWESGLYRLETADGKSKTIFMEKNPEEFELSVEWEVHFPEGWGAPASAIFPSLHSWTVNPDDGIKYFSGIAKYRKKFEFSDTSDLTNRYILDLGEVKLLGDVYLNGVHLGVLWHPPYCVDITEAIWPGENKLEVEVANTWSNRLTGDAKLPEDQRLTSTNIKHVTGPLYKKLPWKDAPLLESGLIGPVKIITVNKASLTF